MMLQNSSSQRVGGRQPSARQGKMMQTARRPVARRSTAEAAPAVEPLKLMIFGAPAAGKGTQCAKIIEKFNLVHISVGDLLREQVQQGTPAGKRAKDFMDSGKLVPDEVVVDMVKATLASPEVQKRGWLLDGYPRTAVQAQAIEKEGIRPDLFLLINVPDDLLVERVIGRRLDPVTGTIYHLKFKPPAPEVVSRLTQRSDDTEEKFRTRLTMYHQNVEAVLGFYSDITKEVDGNQSMEKVFASVDKKITDLIAHRGHPLTAYCAEMPEADECRVYED